jgi:hypothetical protein
VASRDDDPALFEGCLHQDDNDKVEIKYKAPHKLIKIAL